MIFALFSLVPEGETKNRVFEHLVSFMARSPLQQDRPIEWLYRLNLLLNLCRTPAERDAEKLRKWEQSGRVLLFLPEKNAAQLREIMMRENNAVIQEYVSAERILKSPFVFPPY